MRSVVLLICLVLSPSAVYSVPCGFDEADGEPLGLDENGECTRCPSYGNYDFSNLDPTRTPGSGFPDRVKCGKGGCFWTCKHLNNKVTKSGEGFYTSDNSSQRCCAPCTDFATQKQCKNSPPATGFDGPQCVWDKTEEACVAPDECTYETKKECNRAKQCRFSKVHGCSKRCDYNGSLGESLENCKKGQCVYADGLSCEKCKKGYTLCRSQDILELGFCVEDGLACSE